VNSLVGGLVDGMRRLLGARKPVAAPLPYGYADLRAGGSRIEIIPQLGGRISALELGGRQWLWTNPAQAPGLPTHGATYGEFAGGFDECFPTSSSCTLPGSVRGFGGSLLPERGELWTQRPHFEVRTDGQPTAVTTWTGERMPYEFQRTVQVSADGAITFDYIAINRGRDPIPFVWSAQPLLPLSPRTRIILPEGIMARVGAQHGIDLGGGSREQRWPRFRLGDRLADMSRPDGVAGQFACKLHFEMPRQAIAIEEGTSRLEITADATRIPNLGLWINRGGWSLDKRQAPARNLSLQPAIGASDSLADALSDRNSVHWLAPDEVREWRMVFRAFVIDDATRAARATPASLRQQP